MSDTGGHEEMTRLDATDLVTSNHDLHTACTISSVTVVRSTRPGGTCPRHSLKWRAIDHSSDPIKVSVAVTGAAAPSDSFALAHRLADRWDRGVDVHVVFVPVDTGSTTAP